MRTKTSAAVAVLLVLGLATPGAADVAAFRNGRLSIQIEALGTQYLLNAPASGTTSGAVHVVRGATTLTSFTLPGGSFSVTGVTVPVTNPLLAPITGLMGTFTNATGTFSQGPGGFGGTMGLRSPANTANPGIVAVCVVWPCADEFQAPVPVGLTVVGVGGEETIEDLITFTIGGAPWTMGTATVPVEGGQEVESGSLTVLGDGYLRVRLVTPIAIEIDTTGLPTEIPSLVAGFGLLSLEIAPVPEPGVGAAGIAGFGTLSFLARQRRRARRELDAA